MLYQDELMHPESVAVWVGDFQTENEFTTYLGQPFERDFGFRLDLDDLPEDSVVLPEKRTLARYNELLQSVSIGRLLSQWSGEDWIHEAERVCLLRGITKAKAMLRFLNLRYRQDLCVHSNAALKFVGNVPWPAGRQRWNELQSHLITLPPFPVLRRRVYGEGTLFSWEGVFISMCGKALPATKTCLVNSLLPAIRHHRMEISDWM
ncbi:MAG TPA: hypothetical protein VJ063_08930 [Verrucomicrobiae bacterium]|nr:hypothetical protein [Verrucomicrobiae bacterium]